jgi:hypothetical protein
MEKTVAKKMLIAGTDHRNRRCRTLRFLNHLNRLRGNRANRAQHLVETACIQSSRICHKSVQIFGSLLGSGRRQHGGFKRPQVRSHRCSVRGNLRPSFGAPIHCSIGLIVTKREEQH